MEIEDVDRLVTRAGNGVIVPHEPGMQKSECRIKKHIHWAAGFLLLHSDFCILHSGAGRVERAIGNERNEPIPSYRNYYG